LTTDTTALAAANPEALASIVVPTDLLKPNTSKSTDVSPDPISTPSGNDNESSALVNVTGNGNAVLSPLRVTVITPAPPTDTDVAPDNVNVAVDTDTEIDASPPSPFTARNTVDEPASNPVTFTLALFTFAGNSTLDSTLATDASSTLKSTTKLEPILSDGRVNVTVPLPPNTTVIDKIGVKSTAANSKSTLSTNTSNTAASS
jgi:hypothetical protein